MSPDAGDAASSPEPGTEQDSSIMAGSKLDRVSSEEKSPPQQSETKPKSNAKDPSRPRRKKARRACFACQRAHLTCGDERPCLRCIKRGLQDQCHDGVRKKAKYLHDAPAEALIPGFTGHYHTNGVNQNTTTTTTAAPSSTNGFAIPQTTNYINPNSSNAFPTFNQASQISPSLVEGNDPMLSSIPGPQSVDGSTYHGLSNQQISPQGLPATALSTASHHSFDTSYIDPSDPSLFNFNISELNFGNHYGALEFGMLGHMSAGAIGTPDVDSMNQLGGQSHHGSLSTTLPTVFACKQLQFQPGLPKLARNPKCQLTAWQCELSSHSPHSQNHDHNGLPSPENQFGQPDQDLLRQSFAQGQRKAPPGLLDHTAQRKRRRDASDIYTSVTAPYPYTQGFHALTAFLQKRYPSKKTLKIAKALASIRPSFISCNKSLNHDDLIFMEKCFQRTLWEYEDFIGRYGTPTIICRRTGEVAAVSKEFSLVTGWRRDVLLGKEANLNVNTGTSLSSGTQTGSSSRGAVTPRIPHVEMDTGRPQAVFLAELMDEDSVVKFYEDFADLAFGASRAAIVGQDVVLLKYKTKQDPGWRDTDQTGDDGHMVKRDENVSRTDGGAISLGDKDGRVSCQVCWTVKRDVFDIPMLIVMNFLPII
ncbi:hypothetical protein AMS68_007406 [Peltaster fructicola]|uniref:Zn(2)-C6 fungal-type domain-containing protein n=1 Tax=Peltaster fructicola TaxID=286661 RepID=A0A6H0Y4X7_9PEZI|nr:hypothetical protein AMS68_007406 [Peltaster fructicola]